MLNVLGDVGSALSAQTAVKTRKGKKKASAKVGLGRTAALHHRSSMLHQMR
jgi:hypothetical protein